MTLLLNKIDARLRIVSFLTLVLVFCTDLAQAQVGRQAETLDSPDEVKLTLDKRVFTPSEVKILQELEENRIDLERREKALELRERLVDLAEIKLNDKVASLQILKNELEGLLKNLSDKEEEELMALAKIYEAMKPVAAASVMDRMDNKIVFDLFKRMKNKTTAQIMEKMATGKARVISEMLAEKSELPPLR